MPKYKIPSLRSLQAFEAAARLENFTRAANELSITESAVSRQIISLEQNLGVTLFVRQNKRVHLNQTGRLYADHVRETLSALDSNAWLLSSRVNNVSNLDIAVLPEFASNWLIPRMRDFYSYHENVRINMVTTFGPISFDKKNFEAAICFGTQTCLDANTDLLFDEEIIPVCSPQLITSPDCYPDELLNYPLLQSGYRAKAWETWFSYHGVDWRQAKLGEFYETYFMLISAAVAGLGVALVPRFLVESCLLYTSPSPRDRTRSRMPSSA